MILSTPRHLLVFRFSALGDVAMTVPVIKTVLQQYPGLQITFVSNAFVAPLFAGIERLHFHAADLKGKHQGVKGMFRLFRELSNLYDFDAIADLHNVLRTTILRLFFRTSFKPIAVIDKGRNEKKALTRKENKVLKPLKSTFQRYADVFAALGLPIQLNQELKPVGNTTAVNNSVRVNNESSENNEASVNNITGSNNATDIDKLPGLTNTLDKTNTPGINDPSVSSQTPGANDFLSANEILGTNDDGINNEAANDTPGNNNVPSYSPIPSNPNNSSNPNTHSKQKTASGAMTTPGLANLSHLKENGIRLIGIAPFAQHAEKMYPPEKMKEVLRLLLQHKNIQVLLFGGGKAETALLQDWEKELLGVRSVAGKMTFAEELELIRQLDLMVSMDSANMHLASLYGVPVVSIWGATHPYAGFYGWGQAPENAIQIDLYCRPCSVFGNKPCFRGDLACMHSISPISVYEKIINAIT